MQVFTKSEYAFYSIRDDILSGQLPGGTKLVVNDLAKKYNISAMPIRTALIKLEELGYVRSVQHTGVWVCEFDFDSYFTYMLLRVGAESIAVRFFALKRTAEDILQLTGIIRQMETALQSSDTQTYGKLNTVFHNYFVTNCSNQPLQEYIESLMSKTHISINFFNWIPSASAQSFHEHQLMLDAVKKQDLEKLSSILIFQRCRSNIDLLSYLKSVPINEIPIDMLRKALSDHGVYEKIDGYIKLFESLRHGLDFSINN